MSFAGHALDMIIRLKQNRAAIELRKQRRGEIRKMYIESIRSKQTEWKNREIPPEELEKIKQNIREKIRNEKRRSIIISLIVFPVALLLALVVFWCFGTMIVKIINP